MSLLLPQTRTGTVNSVRPLNIHGDRYMDLAISLEDAEIKTARNEPINGRVSSQACPPDLVSGDRVSVKIMMGMITHVSRN